MCLSEVAHDNKGALNKEVYRTYMLIYLYDLEETWNTSS